MNQPLPAEPPLARGTYQHYSGKLYEVTGLACHSETLDWHVIYRPLYEHAGQPDIWVRPYNMFVEEVKIDGRWLPRFQKVKS